MFNIFILQQKEAVIMACIDSLTQITRFDFNNEDAKEAANETLSIIKTYPGIEGFKRCALRADTADHYIYRVHIQLQGIVSNGEVSHTHFTILNEDLLHALYLIQSTMHGRTPTC
jgi:hypothetical protein